MNPLNLVIVMKSTVPPGTGLTILERELAGTGIGYAANPEFRREGQAVIDWMSPARIVIMPALNGCGSGDRSVDTVRRMYAGVDAPVIVTDITGAEMIKHASNAFLATPDPRPTPASFINAIASLCDSLGTSIDDVSKGLTMDSRTGSRIYARVASSGSHPRLRSCKAGKIWASVPGVRYRCRVDAAVFHRDLADHQRRVHYRLFQAHL